PRLRLHEPAAPDRPRDPHVRRRLPRLLTALLLGLHLHIERSSLAAGPGLLAAATSLLGLYPRFKKRRDIPRLPRWQPRSIHLYDGEVEKYGRGLCVTLRLERRHLPGLRCGRLGLVEVLIHEPALAAVLGGGCDESLRDACDNFALAVP